MTDLARREVRVALQEIRRIEQIAALEVPVRDEARIAAALGATPPPPLPGVLAAWNTLRVRRRVRAYGLTLTVGRSFYTTGAVPFFTVIFPGGDVVATFAGARADLAPLVHRHAAGRALAALGLRFPSGLLDPAGFALVWDLLTCGEDLAPRPDQPARAGAPADVDEVVLPEVRWGDLPAGPWALRWTASRLQIVPAPGKDVTLHPHRR